MNKYCWTSVVGVTVMVLFCVSAVANPHQLAVGVRQHVDHTTFDEYPFGEDDLSYGLAYEYHEGPAYWQIAVLYADDVTGTTNDLDFVLTPQINIVLKDAFWRLGVGGLTSYTKGDDVDEWTDLYWQVMAGLGLPVFALDVDVMAYYPFESWGDIGDFDIDDVEFGGWISYEF